MLENISLAFQGIWGHKLRSFLTMLGIIIGIASIIAIISTIKGTNEQIKQNLVGSGNNAVNISLYQNDYPMSFDYTEVPEGVPFIDEDIMEKLQEIDEVDKVATFYQRDYAESILHGSTYYNGPVYGIDLNYFDVIGYRVFSGRDFTERDFDEFHKVVILDRNAAESLFGTDNPIGKTVEIKGEPFTVVGLAEERSEFQPVINTLSDYQMYYQNTSGKLFLPAALWEAVYIFDEPQRVVLRAVDTDSMTEAGRKGSEILNAELHVSDKTITYRSEDLLEQAKHLQELSESTNQQLIWIASISLVVGGIGVMNIMLVSVTERTREIGLKKAIGAAKNKILLQFLTEAAVLTSIGGLLGVLGGIGMAQIISGMSGAPVAIDIPAAIIAVVFSVLIGIVFGLLPAVKAANLNPIEALRRE
ncbi:MAG: ABC transporter permease [Lachnospiraceae bacterium]|nr:ABC transporter permease [Candidatus Minthocola equi]